MINMESYYDPTDMQVALFSKHAHSENIFTKLREFSTSLTYCVCSLCRCECSKPKYYDLYCSFSQSSSQISSTEPRLIECKYVSKSFGACNRSGRTYVSRYVKSSLPMTYKYSLQMCMLDMFSFVLYWP